MCLDHFGLGCRCAAVKHIIPDYVEIGITDENGRIVIEDFYPDEWYEVYLAMDEEDDPLWSADPSGLPETVKVDLRK
jgi:hypothetical protein